MLVDSLNKYNQEMLPATNLALRMLHERRDLFCMLDCEGVPDELELLQLYLPAIDPTRVFLVDCRRLVPLPSELQELLISPRICKVVHDVHCDAHAMYHKLGLTLSNVFDTQLAYERLCGELHIGFGKLLEIYQCPPHPLKKAMQDRMDKDPSLWNRRPLPSDVLAYAAFDVTRLAVKRKKRKEKKEKRKETKKKKKEEEEESKNM